MRSPTRHAVLTACVALLLVFAGCNGGSTPTSTATTTDNTATSTAGPATTTTTATATSTTTTSTTPAGTWSPNAPAELYPPGVASNGTLTNVSTLVDAHFEAMANESMALTHGWTTANESRTYRYTHGQPQTPYISTGTITTNGDRVRKQYYRTDSSAYYRFTGFNRTRHYVYQNTTGSADGNLIHGSPIGLRDSIEVAIEVGNYSVNGTVERNGRTFVQLSADEVSPRGEQLWTKSYEGTVLVTPEGVIHSVDATWTQESDGDTERVTVSTTLDTDVEWIGPPAWVSDVPHLSLSIVEGGHALEIRNTGGGALPADTRFEVTGSNEPVWSVSMIGGVEGTVTTDARLEPGEAVYVTGETDGNAASFTLHDEPTRGDDTFGAASIYGHTENTTVRLVTGLKNNLPSVHRNCNGLPFRSHFVSLLMSSVARNTNDRPHTWGGMP